MPRIMFQIWLVIFSDFSHQLINSSTQSSHSDQLVVCDHKSLDYLGLANQALVIEAKEKRKLIYAARIESQNKHLPTKVTLYVI